MAVWIGFIGVDFEVLDPPELAEHVLRLSDRYGRAVGGLADKRYATLTGAPYAAITDGGRSAGR